jgi:hypothetical protein
LHRIDGQLCLGQSSLLYDAYQRQVLRSVVTV